MCVTIRVDGAPVASIDRTSLERYGTKTRDVTFECSSGELLSGRWRGIDLGGVLESLPLPDETTHLLVEARDGHRTCLQIGDAFDGLLAFDRLDDRPDGKAPEGELPRLLLPGLEGPRTLKWVATMEPIHLEPDEDPADFEPVPPSVEADGSADGPTGE